MISYSVHKFPTGLMPFPNIGLCFCISMLFCVTCASNLEQYLHQGTNLNGNTLHGSEQEINLEDFFWTGSGDGPPAYLRKSSSDSGPTQVRHTFIKTSTVLATVYIDGYAETEGDPLCVFDCSAEDTSSVNYSPTDRRYWLLTVVAGFFGKRDFKMIEEKLAKLYRLAFSRQQARHLGITNSTTQLPIERNYRRKRELKDTNLSISPTKTLQDEAKFTTDPQLKANLTMKNNTKNFYRTSDQSGQRTVRVVIHNFTQWTEYELKNAENLVDYMNERRGNSVPLSNQTEFIYTVFVGQKPVLAVTAADDMKLVSQQEMVKVMENDVYTKAEPYLKEPLATPLIPSILVNGSSNIFQVATENPIMFAIICTSFFLLIILLISLVLMTRAKRKRSAEVRRLATQALISQNSTPTEHMHSSHQRVIGIDNFGFQKSSQFGNGQKLEKGKPPTILFPLPPSSPTSSSTSDSSIYYPKRKSHMDIQDVLEEKSASLFNKKSVKVIDSKDGQEHSDHMYATISKCQSSKKNKYKSRKNRLPDNRVGSINDAGVQTSPTSSDRSETTYALPSHNEDYNPAHYYSEKYAKSEMYPEHLKSEDFEVASSVFDSPNEAINREILRVLQKGEKSPGSGSIGSYLSMASVKSFPKCSAPEPLSRILEPVTVTHFDMYDAEERMKAENGSNGLPEDIQLIRSHSDGTDPGVTGPIVWEIHKKEVQRKKANATRKDTEDGDSMPNVSLMKPGGAKMENRGKSATVTSENELFHHNTSDLMRPVTASIPQSTITEEASPPTPSKKAWSSTTPSPLVRPLSAGPFHRPPAPVVDVARVLAPQEADKTNLSSAPLIEAIQNELKKFNRGDNN
ncbi:uncharacterized protein LOC129788750 isoform X1 [Lutzomyia longipalpis]|uniref:uncharacterized protein LOC129788750 isoform X1 n=1 Tax=Lutzomyia longipalpis TaxID=7200 RepID=UPI0024839351|nr:uncharacterized protein LOC129788750 isoform X1 [Lutzomyia longipalpis]